MEFKTLLKRFIVIFIFLLLLSVIFGHLSLKLIKNNIINDKAIIVEQLATKYPDDEELIIKALINDKSSAEEGLKILEKYGIVSEINKTTSYKDLRNKIILLNTFFFITSILITTFFYLYHLKKTYSRINQINLYINDVLNDKNNFSIKDYEEGSFSALRNDVYKITNKLKEQNDRILKDKKYLEETLSDISHQLKTPLTSMYMINDLLESNNIDIKKKREFLLKNRMQLERIEWLVTSLLKLSRLESGTIKLRRENVKVFDLVKKSLEPLKIQFELKHQAINVKGNLNTTINCDFNWTSEALLNIIKNAHEHTNDKGHIDITWKDNPLYTEIIITDDGEGIKEEDIKHIFERFYKSSTNTKESIGIGLNMSKQIIDKQNGDISVKSNLGKGTSFEIKFYKNNI